MIKAPDTNSDDRSLREVCEILRNLISPQVRYLQSYHWSGATLSQTLEFVKRAAVVRQFEAAEAVLSLVDAGKGAASVAMLRPAYEELLWIIYLEKKGEVALKLVQLLSRKEILDSYTAQKEFLGQKGIRAIGFTSRISRRVEKGMGDPSKELRELGASLGWRNGSTQPSIAFIAREVGREKQYRYLYQGTSRSVHFSPHELGRRVWGQHSSVSIQSSNFERYWSDFALSWSFRVLVETLNCAGYADTLAGENSDEMLSLVQALRPVQILTASELEGWDDPRPEILRKS